MQQLILGSAAALRRAQQRMKRFTARTRSAPELAPLVNGEVIGMHGVGVNGGLVFQEELLSLQRIQRSRRHEKSRAGGAADADVNCPELKGLQLAQFAHDLDNLLMVIANRAELAQLDLAQSGQVGDGQGEDDVSAEGPIADAIHAIRSAAQQALDLSKLLRCADTPSVVCKQPVNLVEAVQHAVNHAQTWLPNKVALVEDLPVQAETWILGNFTQLQRVIRNVLSNAAHALRADGRIIVSLELVGGESESLRRSRQFEEKSQFAMLRVCDNGIGMDAKTCEHIFEPGFSRRSGGCGLGMTIVSDIVHDHGGKISLESTPGSGTQVGLSFPLARNSGASTNQ